MENFDNIMNLIEQSGSKSKGKAKRKWREIEALKDKHRLMKELQDIDLSYDDSIEDIF